MSAPQLAPNPENILKIKTTTALALLWRSTMQILVSIGQKMKPLQLPPLNINAIGLQLLCTTLKTYFDKSIKILTTLVIFRPHTPSNPNETKKSVGFMNNAILTAPIYMSYTTHQNSNIVRILETVGNIGQSLMWMNNFSIYNPH